MKLASAQYECKPQLYGLSFKAMGSPCEIKVWSSSTEQADRALLSARSEIDRLEQKYTRYKETSLTSQINRAAGSGQRTPIDTETYQLLCYADEAYRLSDGLFDITSGVLRRGWDFKRGRIPTPLQLDSLRQLIAWSRVEFDEQSISLPISGMEIDFGGYVKEYAADAAANVCFQCGILSALVNLGGDIRVVGPQPDGVGWPVGIHHPRIKNRSMHTLYLSQGGVATSGDYERYFEMNGVRYAHILDPKTGYPISGAASVTVHAESCLLAGTAATIAMLHGDQALDCLNDLKVPYLLVDQDLNCIYNLI